MRQIFRTPLLGLPTLVGHLTTDDYDKKSPHYTTEHSREPPGNAPTQALLPARHQTSASVRMGRLSACPFPFGCPVVYTAVHTECPFPTADHSVQRSVGTKENAPVHCTGCSCCAPQVPRQFGAGEGFVFPPDAVAKRDTYFRRAVLAGEVGSAGLRRHILSRLRHRAPAWRL